MRAFRPLAATTNVAATATSSTAAQMTLPSPADPEISVRIVNAGPDTVFIEFGTSAVGAATTSASMPVLASATEVFSLQRDQDHHRVICAATETATVYFTVGTGV